MENVKAIATSPVFAKSPGFLFAKRAFDIIFSLGVVTVGFVPGVVLAAAIARESKGSPLYVSERIGRNGKPFKIFKFRTMYADADDFDKYFTPEQRAQWEAEHKVDDDPRITKIGHALRGRSIDEFPQFINVLLGQMSVVGCRPITKDELKWFGDDVDELLSMRPGVTGLWQTSLRNDATFESGLRQKLELEYVRNASLLMDWKCFWRTFRSMSDETGK